ncbi:heterokaryon incompatibility protein-domain-containing protein [Coniella lustricola]|uniref:Heterokaryon incompatibility protein-domain-containing protein n=1 Tax=Coniella lustricola TaxID=2025994 RepID=A0A2T3AL16_9PEZI|nr:heterokaryon incompatibility protein-domain-containing protein [Coniella lustricola]
MRLLNTTSFEIEQFGEYISGSSFHVHDPADTRLPGPPEYAILSHTWGPDELTFQDMQQEAKAKAMLKAGYDKVYRSCQVAKSEGYNWIWIDTCCIDKTSSAELSEAINSMFGYYRDSAVCYAYLGDVSGTQPLSKHDHDDQQWRTDEVPRWYTRGWTLQELIAPYNVQFYSADWRPLGSKHDHLAGISRITNIDSYALEGGDLTRISIARRLAWLAKRETTRMEDMAYCMLGIFDINLTLLYGEGVKAFVRLQEEILRSTNADQSVFAWTSGFLLGRGTVFMYCHRIRSYFHVYA